jgi:hypothetical protein
MRLLSMSVAPATLCAKTPMARAVTTPQVNIR